MEGLIVLGYDEERYRQLSRKLNKKMILIDTYPQGAYDFQNVGVDDYSADIRLENIWTAVDIMKRCLLQKQARTATTIDG